jgi:hypothetical protein
VLRGDAGRDGIQTFGGRDLVVGGPGGDACLNVGDGRPGDVILGGPGRDSYFDDPGDRSIDVEERLASGCETSS